MKIYIISSLTTRKCNGVWFGFDGFRKSKLHNEFFKQPYSQGKTLFSTRIY